MRLIVPVTLLVMAAFVTGADMTTVLSDGIDGAPASEMMDRYFLDHADAALARRKQRYEALQTPEDIRAYQSAMRSFFITQLGGFPERTPLNARVTERGARDGYRYEKIIFESQPNHFVTGILFLPEGPGPYPGIIIPCGHSANGKASLAYQRACVLLALNGMAAFIYDPVGQGERYTYLKSDGSPEFSSTLEHTLLGVGAILTGTNLATYRIWDGMRAIDYLVEREDIDADRIGCAGNSGGGTLTSYLMALDERIQCASPACYLTSFERLIRTIGPQDAEQNIYGQIAYGMNHADYIHQRAPKPTLICAATQDFFDISGTWDSFREAKRLFTRMGYAERVSIIEYDATHGYAQPLREAMARWMSRWLLEEDRIIEEPEFEVFSDAEAQVTPEGQVMLLEGAVSVLELNAQRGALLRAQRAAFRDASDDDVFIAQIKQLTAFDEDIATQSPRAENTGTRSYNGYTVEQWLLYPEAGILLPVVWAIPATITGDYRLILHPGGKEAVFAADGPGMALLEAGHPVIAPDLRGWGETHTEKSPKGWQHQIGPDWQDYFFGYLLGKSHVGMRAADIQAVMRHIKGREIVGDASVKVTALAQATVPALHAAVFEPELFDLLVLDGGIPSWTAVVNTPRARHQLAHAVHNALAWYDLPDLEALLPEEKLEVVNSGVLLF